MKCHLFIHHTLYVCSQNQLIGRVAEESTAPEPSGALSEVQWCKAAADWGKWACSRPADMAGSSPDSTALPTTPSNQALTETNVPTLSSLHHFTFRHNLALFSPSSNMVLHRHKCLPNRTRRMDEAPLFIFCGCKYFQESDQSKHRSTHKALSQICQQFLCNYGKGFAAKLAVARALRKCIGDATFVFGVSRNRSHPSCCVPNIKKKM